MKISRWKKTINKLSALKREVGVWLNPNPSEEQRAKMMAKDSVRIIKEQQKRQQPKRLVKTKMLPSGDEMLYYSDGSTRLCRFQSMGGSSSGAFGSTDLGDLGGDDHDGCRAEFRTEYVDYSHLLGKK